MLKVNLFLSGAPHVHFFTSSATILLVVWSGNGSSQGSALISKASLKVNLLNDDTFQWNCATVDLLNEKSISGVHSSRASL